MKKKSILFINESLACAGGEKSLINLMSAIDYDRYDVYLQLFRYGCPWDKYIDHRVNVLPPLPYTCFTELSLVQAVFYAILHGKLKWLYSRLRYTLMLRWGKGMFNVRKSVLFWESQKDCFETIPDNYDYVIAYAQGIPTFYVADKASSSAKKMAWINVTYAPDNPEKDYIENIYKKIDTVTAVSETIKELESDHWPTIKDKLVVFRDLINPNTIIELSKESIELSKVAGRLTLVTLGRLTPQKGYDLALGAAVILKSKGIDYVWYILGCGPLYDEIDRFIKDHDLQDNVKLLGVKENPYPYLRLADIYVQTSKHEGFGIAISEARILNIPVVATRFNTVGMQMKDEKNGLIADLTPEAVADAIIRLNEDKLLFERIKDYLSNEAKGNLETLPAFYKILGQ